MKRIFLILLIVLLPSAGTRSAVDISVRPQLDPEFVVQGLAAEPEGAVDQGISIPVNLTRLPPELGMFHDPVFDFFLAFPNIPGFEIAFGRDALAYLLQPGEHDLSYGWPFRNGLWLSGQGDDDTPGDWSAYDSLTGGWGGFQPVGGTGGGFVGAGGGRPSNIFVRGGGGGHSGGTGGFGGFPVGGASGSGGAGNTGGNTGAETGGGTVPPVSAVPLPMAGWMLLSGLGALLGLSRRRRAVA